VAARSGLLARFVKRSARAIMVREEPRRGGSPQLKQAEDLALTAIGRIK